METSTESETRPLIPTHIAWPMLVVALLLLSFVVVSITVIAANSDGGAAVVEDSPYAPRK